MRPQGALPGGGDDAYWDAGRMGGTLSHLAREFPPTGEACAPPQLWAPLFAGGSSSCLMSPIPVVLPPAEEERRPLEGLPLGAVVKYDGGLRLKGSVLRGPGQCWLGVVASFTQG